MGAKIEWVGGRKDVVFTHKFQKFFSHVLSSHGNCITGFQINRAEQLGIGAEHPVFTVLVLPGEEVGHDPAEVVVVAGVERHAVGLRPHPPDVAVAAGEEPVGRAADTLRPERGRRGAGPPQEPRHDAAPQPRRRQRQDRRDDQHGRGGRRHGWQIDQLASCGAWGRKNGNTLPAEA